MKSVLFEVSLSFILEAYVYTPDCLSHDGSRITSAFVE